MSKIESFFEPLYGSKCWNVWNGIGSYLTFEFGEPHFKILREPFHSSILKYQRHAARRLVKIYGDWSLWIRDCEWSFYINDVLIGHSESSKKELREIAYDLEGQVLQKVRTTRNGQSTFEFDLGGRLFTQPYSDKQPSSELDELWSLFQPTGIVISLQSDGRFNQGK
jgi:hypothetical protein